MKDADRAADYSDDDDKEDVQRAAEAAKEAVETARSEMTDEEYDDALKEIIDVEEELPPVPEMEAFDESELSDELLDDFLEGWEDAMEMLEQGLWPSDETDYVDETPPMKPVDIQAILSAGDYGNNSAWVNTHTGQVEVFSYDDIPSGSDWELVRTRATTDSDSKGNRIVIPLILEGIKAWWEQTGHAPKTATITRSKKGPTITLQNGGKHWEDAVKTLGSLFKVYRDKNENIVIHYW
jgi:hypothetical protein